MRQVKLGVLGVGNVGSGVLSALAAKGDEIEHFGWNLPPASFRRGQQPHAAPSSF